MKVAASGSILERKLKNCERWLVDLVLVDGLPRVQGSSWFKKKNVSKRISSKFFHFMLRAHNLRSLLLQIFRNPCVMTMYDSTSEYKMLGNGCFLHSWRGSRTGNKEHWSNEIATSLWISCKSIIIYYNCPVSTSCDREDKVESGDWRDFLSTVTHRPPIDLCTHVNILEWKSFHVGQVPGPSAYFSLW